MAFGYDTIKVSRATYRDAATTQYPVWMVSFRRRRFTLRHCITGLAVAAILAADSHMSRGQTSPAGAEGVRAGAMWNVNSPLAATTPTTKPTTPETASATTSFVPADRGLVSVARPHVLIVSIDGLRPDCMLRADTPTLRSLMARGSFTMYARTTDIAITTPSHVSMLTGVTPERHGIAFNADPPDDAIIPVPTIFDAAKHAGLSTAMASGKRKFTLFTRTRSLDYSAVSAGEVGADAAVGQWAQEIVHEHRPDLLFVHFAGADVAGHGKGWGTPAQLDAIAGIDRALAGVLHEFEAADLTDETYIIVSADHGGSMRTHGRDDPRSRYIPWIFVGPGVRKDFDLTRLGKDYDIATYDTFATACYLLGIAVPGDSDGKPILPAFGAYELLQPDRPPGSSTRRATAATQPTTKP